MRDISAAELHKISDKENLKNFNKSKNYFRRKLREVAKNGGTHVTFNPRDYTNSDKIEAWLKKRGFKVIRCTSLCTRIEW